MSNIYYIRNIGCDDETQGIFVLTEEMEKNHFLDTFKQIVANLNKNSYYGCMPTIEVYKIPESMLRRPTENDDQSKFLYIGEDKYALDNDIYIFDRIDRWTLREGVERII